MLFIKNLYILFIKKRVKICMCTCACVIYYLYILRRFRKLDITSKMSKIPLWGQFLPRPSVVLVVIFCLRSPTLEEKTFSSCLIRDDQWLKSTTSLVNLPRLFFQCGTLQAKNDYKCNTWSRQKFSPH